MTLDELIGDINRELYKVFPTPESREELDGDDLDSVESTVKEVLENATEAIDAEADDEEAEG